MCQRGHAGGIDCRHRGKMFEDSGELRGVRASILLIYSQPRQARDAQ
jgi:hypothetical protein